MRTYLMAGNWKMNKPAPETVVLTQQLCNQYNRKWDNVDIVLCPPAIDIKAAYTVLDFDKTKISLGAQNAHWEESGAFTGEISIPMIKDAVFEMPSFEAGTKGVALAVAANKEADTIIGGGDSVAAVNKFDLADQMTFISTGGGASMELVQGEALPGGEALK